jgi:hypothetical protein
VKRAPDGHLPFLRRAAPCNERDAVAAIAIPAATTTPVAKMAPRIAALPFLELVIPVSSVPNTLVFLVSNAASCRPAFGPTGAIDVSGFAQPQQSDHGNLRSVRVSRNRLSRFPTAVMAGVGRVTARYGLQTPGLSLFSRPSEANKAPIAQHTSFCAHVIRFSNGDGFRAFKLRSHGVENRSMVSMIVLSARQSGVGLDAA